MFYLRTANCDQMLVIDSLFTGTKATNFSEAMKSGPTSPVVALVAFFSIWSVAGLAGFHSYLTALNMTTNEDVSFQDMLMLFGSLKYLSCTPKILAINKTLGSFKKFKVVSIIYSYVRK